MCFRRPRTRSVTSRLSTLDTASFERRHRDFWRESRGPGRSTTPANAPAGTPWSSVPCVDDGTALENGRSRAVRRSRLDLSKACVHSVTRSGQYFQDAVRAAREGGPHESATRSQPSQSARAFRHLQSAQPAGRTHTRADSGPVAVRDDRGWDRIDHHNDHDGAVVRRDHVNYAAASVGQVQDITDRLPDERSTEQCTGRSSSHRRYTS